MGLGTIGSKPQSLTVTCDGCIELSCLLKYVGQVVMGFHLGGIEVQRLSVLSQGFFQAPFIDQGNAQIVMGCGTHFKIDCHIFIRFDAVLDRWFSTTPRPFDQTRLPNAHSASGETGASWDTRDCPRGPAASASQGPAAEPTTRARLEIRPSAE